eukprot:4060600-Prymnesium_polylepis.1
MRAYAKVTSNYGQLWPTTDRAVRTLANSPSAKVADLGVKVRLKNCTVAKEVRVGSIARRPSINANSALAIGERGILVAGGCLLGLERVLLHEPSQGIGSDVYEYVHESGSGARDIMRLRSGVQGLVCVMCAVWSAGVEMPCARRA